MVSLSNIVSIIKRRKPKAKIYKFYAKDRDESQQNGLMAMEGKPTHGDIIKNPFLDGVDYRVAFWDQEDVMWLEPEGTRG